MIEYKVSIIVPVYNVSKYLARCLESLITQTYKNLEIIVVDDGSTDGSSPICDFYEKKDSRIKVIHKLMRDWEKQEIRAWRREPEVM